MRFDNGFQKNFPIRQVVPVGFQVEIFYITTYSTFTCNLTVSIGHRQWELMDGSSI
jgi:hypothetical protein